MPRPGQGATPRPRRPVLAAAGAQGLTRLLVLLAALLPRAAPAQSDLPGDCFAGVSGAIYDSQTSRYGHEVLGRRSEWAALTVFVQFKLPCRAGSVSLTVELPEDMVFEDAAPVLADLTGDGEPEVIVVESQQDQGARLAIYGRQGGTMIRLAATPYIGTRHRWLAQLGAADLDGDGRPEIGYIDRPHLARVLRLWQLQGKGLVELASAPGLTNHRFGAPAIQGGIRRCPGARPEIVTASADWSRLLAVRWDGSRLESRPIGSATTPEDFARAMACG